MYLLTGVGYVDEGQIDWLLDLWEMVGHNSMCVFVGHGGRTLEYMS